MSYDNAKKYILDHKNSYSRHTIKKILVSHGYEAKLINQIYIELGYKDENNLKNYNFRSFIYAVIGILISISYFIIKTLSNETFSNALYLAILTPLAIIFVMSSLTYFHKSKKKNKFAISGFIMNMINILGIGFVIIVMVLSLFFYIDYEPMLDDTIEDLSSTQEIIPKEIDIIHIYVKNTSDNLINANEDTFNILLKFQAENVTIDDKNIILKLKTESNEQIVTYSSDFVSSKNYNLTYLLEETVNEDNKSKIETIMFIFLSEFDINKTENISLELILYNEVMTLVELKMPNEMTFEETYIYP